MCEPCKGHSQGVQTSFLAHLLDISTVLVHRRPHCPIQLDILTFCSWQQHQILTIRRCHQISRHSSPPVDLQRSHYAFRAVCGKLGDIWLKSNAPCSGVKRHGSQISESCGLEGTPYVSFFNPCHIHNELVVLKSADWVATQMVYYHRICDRPSSFHERGRARTGNFCLDACAVRTLQLFHLGKYLRSPSQIPTRVECPRSDSRGTAVPCNYCRELDWTCP